MKMLLLVIGLILLPIFLCADTYDERTLVRIDVPDAGSQEFIQNSPIDVVDAGPGWAKALLRPEEFRLLAGRGLKVEVLSEEMEQDRALWREADAAAAAHSATAYYTASKFNTINPPAGSLMEHLLALHNAHPDITRLYDIGDTVSGNYDIIALQLSDNPDTEENEPKIRIYGNIHGDEKSAEMVPCDVLDWILDNYPSNPDAVKLVEEAETWFIPMGNPDGNANNSRYNAHGIDLNRNFWGPDGNEDGSPFSEPETQAIRDLTEVRGKRFSTSISFHSGATCFNSVFNYTPVATTDEPIFFSSRTGGPLGEAMPSPFGLAEAYWNGCTTSGFWFTNGADWYITQGDTNDWSYYVWSDIDTTLELTLIKTPPPSDIPTFCAEHRQAVINYMLASFQGIFGRMTDISSGAPLDGTMVATATASAYIDVPHLYQEVFTDPDVGDFHRVLQPGTYTVQCLAPAYQTVSVNDVIVSPGTTTVVDCSMGSCSLPSIITQPASQTIISGQTATMSVVANGDPTLSYQWYRGVSGDTSIPISGATSSSYTTPPLIFTTSYWVRVTDGCGSVDSDTATITVCHPAIISVHPVSQTIVSGQTATMTVTAGGDLPLSYQWYEGISGNISNPIAGATSNSYTTPALIATTSYWVRVTNSCGTVDSNTATITVCNPPSITVHPQSQNITSGQTASMSVLADGDVPQSYQWYQVSGNISNPIAGATSSSYTTPALIVTTSYWVRVTNGCGFDDSNTAVITVCTPPSITTQPVSQTLTTGQTATMNVAGAGDVPQTYQWYLGASGDISSPIAGAISNSYTTQPLAATISYWVRITNGCGAADSMTATITISPVGPVCLYFCDDFEDLDDSGWSFKGGTWNASAPDLIASTTRSASAVSPAFAAPANRSVEANAKIMTEGGRVSVFGWYQSKSESVELRLMQDKGKILLLQKTGGISKKVKYITPLNAGQNYHVKLVYDGSDIRVFLDGNPTPIITMTPLSAPLGGVAFKVKTTGLLTTGSMSDIAVN